MRWLIAVVLILLASVSLAQASDGLGEGYGLILIVCEMGTCHTDNAVVGLASGDIKLEGFDIDGPTPVHIVLPDDCWFDFRPFGGDTTLSADIRWFGGKPSGRGQYELQLRFADWCEEDFAWILPPYSPKVSLTDETSETQTFYMPISYQPVYCYGQGQSRLTVDFGPQSIPEPGSIFVVGVGLIALLGRGRLNR